MKRFFAATLLASSLIASTAQASECQIHFTFVDRNVQRALSESKYPQWQGHDQMCERLKTFDGAINVAGGFSVGADTVSFFVELTVGDRVTGLSIPDNRANFVQSGRFPHAKTQSELIEIAITAFRGTTEMLLQSWYESGQFEQAAQAFLMSSAKLKQR